MRPCDVPDEDLVGLLRGELGRARLEELVEHLQGCDDCRRALVELAAGHSALEAARRLLLEPPEAGLARLTVAGAAPAVREEPVLPPLRVPSRRRSRRAAALVAAAAVVLAGAVGATVLTVRRDDAPEPAPARSAALEPLGGSARGRVTMAPEPGRSGETAMTIATTGLPQAGAGHFYYAWLLDPRTAKMLPLGVVSVAEPVQFEVPADLVGRYSAVDISLQADDGDPAHSSTSVLRATY